MSDIEAAMLRNEFGRIIALALSSQGYATTDSEVVGLAFLRELEEQGVTLRLMTRDELVSHRDPAALQDEATR